jgi:hypothetical protein
MTYSKGNTLGLSQMWTISKLFRLVSLYPMRMESCLNQSQLGNLTLTLILIRTKNQTPPFSSCKPAESISRNLKEEASIPSISLKKSFNQVLFLMIEFTGYAFTVAMTLLTF